MPESLTLKAIADHFADSDGVADPHERKSRFRQLRAITQSEFVLPDVAVSQGQTAVFSVEKAAQLRILQTLTDIGFKGPVLSKFNAHLTETPLGCNGRKQPGTMIALAVAGTRAEQEWVLEIRVARNLATGELNYLGGLRLVDEPRNSVSDEILSAGRITYAAITLPVSDLIRPVIEKYEDA